MEGTSKNYYRVVIIMKIEYSDFIKMLNEGQISYVKFGINNYNHYSNCEIFCYNLISPSNKNLFVISVVLTKDKSEHVSFFFHFDEKYKLFKIKHQTYNLKQIWNEVYLTKIEYNEIPKRLPCNVK